MQRAWVRRLGREGTHTLLCPVARYPGWLEKAAHPLIQQLRAGWPAQPIPGALAALDLCADPNTAFPEPWR